LDFPLAVRSLAEFYLKKRLIILNDGPIRIDPRLGRPLPYLASWFADAFGLNNDKIRNKFALTLSYAALIVSIRDDLLDSKVSTANAHICLANMYSTKYFMTFESILPSRSEFWYIFSNCLNKWAEYESWHFIFRYDAHINPLSRHFLKRASSYLVDITLPTLSAIAIITNNKNKIHTITKFLRDYYMGFRIVDDIRDWREDLKVRSFNHSSILYYVSKKIKSRRRLTTEAVMSVFSNGNCIKEIYDSIKTFYIAARDDIISFNSSSLEKFIDTQISLQEDERNNFNHRMSEFYNRLNDLLV
jgi:hypothetical protein